MVRLHPIRSHHQLQRGKLSQAPFAFEINLNLVFTGPHRQKPQDLVYDLQTQGRECNLARELSQVEHSRTELSNRQGGESFL